MAKLIGYDLNIYSIPVKKIINVVNLDKYYPGFIVFL